MFHFREIMAQSLMWLMLITIAMGMCLMNGYSVIKVQTHSPHKREMGEERFVVLHPLPNSKGKL